jgi:predicted Zn-dependent protease
MTMSGGTIAITLGLLTKLQTEDQIAFVICHEMAHHYGRHQENRFLEIARLNYDKEVRHEMRSISRSEYGAITKSTALGMKLGVSVMQHSRDKEYEADSVGLQMYLNAGYNKNEVIALLNVLDSVDYEKQKAVDPKKYFNFADYPFKDKWLSYDSTADSFERDEHAISDSLRTHPDCKKRIVAVQRQLRDNNVTATTTQWPVALREGSRFELVASAFHYGRYSFAIFNALQLLEEYPDNAWLHDIVAKSFVHVHRLQKAHEANDALPLPAPYYDGNYNHFLAFMHNLRLIEMENISVRYK